METPELMDDYFENYEVDVKDEIMGWYRTRYGISYFAWLDIQENPQEFRKICDEYWIEYFKDK